MKDTGFTLTDSRTARLAPLYRRTATRLEKTSDDGARVDTGYFSGAGGLLSTAEAYLQVAQMLVNGGETNGGRYLSPKTVELMASNHVGDLYAAGCAHQTVGPCDLSDQRGMGFGVGVDVVRDPLAAGVGVSSGSFGWAGAFGTTMWVDRKEQMVTILMVSTRVVQVQRDFEYAARQAPVE